MGMVFRINTTDRTIPTIRTIPTLLTIPTNGTIETTRPPDHETTRP